MQETFKTKSCNLAVTAACYGKRNWLKYVNPFTFNITVNDMRDVVRHQDVGVSSSNVYFGIQSSCGSGLSIALKCKKRP